MLALGVTCDAFPAGVHGGLAGKVMGTTRFHLTGIET